MHLLKAGSKRRRTQEEIEQEEEEMKKDPKAQAEHLKFQYEKLQAELSKTKEEARSNRAASEILTQMINKGELEQAQDGSILVSKSKDRRPKPQGDVQMK